MDIIRNVVGCPVAGLNPNAATPDIALVRASRQAAVGKVAGFNVLAGGKLGSGGHRVATLLDVFVEPGWAADLAAALVLIFRNHGPREPRKARSASLLEEWSASPELRRSCRAGGARHGKSAHGACSRGGLTVTAKSA